MGLAEDLAELDALERYVASLPAPYRLPAEPHERQRAFLALRCREALYGGSAGGGKSVALLLAAAQYAHIPGYSAILFRRTFPELYGAGGLVPKSRLLFGGVATWRASEHTWIFPSGATVAFSYLANVGDELRYQGQEFHFVGWDELTHFAADQYLYLFSRMRRPDSGPLSRVPLRVRAATNPGGPGHRWVMERFGLRIDGSQAEEWTEKRDDVSRQVTREQRPFVPARLNDNPHLNVAEYRDQQLAELDSTRRAQLEDGRWIADGEGLVYASFARSRNCIPEWKDEGAWHFVLAVDLGTSESKKTSAFALLASAEDTRNRVVCLRAWSEAGLTPSSTADRIAEVLEEWPIDVVVVDAGGLGGGYVRDFQARFGLMIQAAEKRDKLGTRKLLNGALDAGDLLIVEPQCGDLIVELETLPWDKRGLDSAPGIADHHTDALLYGWRECRAYAAEAPAKSPAPGSPAEWEAKEREMLARWDREQREAEAGEWASDD